MAELADARDLKSRVPIGTCGFEPRLGHLDAEIAVFLPRRHRPSDRLLTDGGCHGDAPCERARGLARLHGISPLTCTHPVNSGTMKNSLPAHPAWNDSRWITHAQRLLDSYRRWLNQDLISREGSPQEQAQRLFLADFVVVSHGTEADPILSYANQCGLELWEMDLPTLLLTPSRLTAEPMHRDERARLLERTQRQGYVDDYQGIRISHTGHRFQIHQAIVWNLLDENDQPVGQAATFSRWTPLPLKDSSI